MSQSSPRTPDLLEFHLSRFRASSIRHGKLICDPIPAQQVSRHSEPEKPEARKEVRASALRMICMPHRASILRIQESATNDAGGHTLVQTGSPGQAEA